MYDFIMKKIENHFDSLITECDEISVFCDGLLLEKQKLPWITEKGEGIDKKETAKNICDKIKNMFDNLNTTIESKLMKKIEMNYKKQEYKDAKFKAKGVNPSVVKKWIDNACAGVFKKIHEFLYEKRNYQKAVVPVCTVLGMVPPFTPIVGITEVFIAVSSAGDFLLDYKRELKGEKNKALDEFITEVEKMMEAPERKEYENPLVNFVSKIGASIGKITKRLSMELKRLMIGISSVIFKKVGLKAEELKKKNPAKKEQYDRVVKTTTTINRKIDIANEKYREMIKNKKKNEIVSESVLFALADIEPFDIGGDCYV